MNLHREEHDRRAYILRWLLKPLAWGVYFVIVFEILFMISPFALYFYSAYGPALNVLLEFESTAWLTQFFLPHFSRTSSALLNCLRPVAISLILIGGALFLAAAIPLYGAKLLRRGQVSGGLYRHVRHPQYVALATVGLGTVLLWPRFIVAITFVVMIYLYYLLARWEEDQCLRRFGRSYRAYVESTGMFLPRAVEARLPTPLPRSRTGRAFLGWVMLAVLVAGSTGVAWWLREISLTTVSAYFRDDATVLSPARLDGGVLVSAFRTAMGDRRVRDAVHAAGATKLLVYVVPEAWRLPDLPLDAESEGGHHTPERFDPARFRVLVTRVRSHDPDARGAAIVTTAFGRDPVVTATVDLEKAAVIGVESPPPHVRWGDIPTPMF